MKIIFIGDIVSSLGRNAVKKTLPALIGDFEPDLVIANAENITGGRGASIEHLQEMQNCGVNYFTSGDHIFWQRGFEDVIDDLPLVRPQNYPSGTPGKGYDLVKSESGKTLLLVNLQGRTFINERIDDPFSAIDEILDLPIDYDACLIDFHAEATSEKHALAFYLDGRVDVIVGTHTHVPTCDNRIFPKGTLYVSDVGMSGSIDSVLGTKSDIIISLYKTGRNQRFEWEKEGRSAFRSVLIDTDRNTIERFDKYLS